MLPILLGRRSDLGGTSSTLDALNGQFRSDKTNRFPTAKINFIIVQKSSDNRIEKWYYIGVGWGTPRGFVQEGGC